MVRIKHRYLLVNILYPELEDSPSKPKVPDVIVFNQPTTESLREGQLRKAIESEIFKLFGEYGAGATNSNLQSKPTHTPPPSRYERLMCHCSKILVTGNVNVYTTGFTRSL